MPGNSIVNFTVPINDYYQTDYEKATMSGSLSSIEMIDKGDITAGKMPTNETEIIVDESILNNMISNSNARQAGYLSINDFIGKKVNIGGVKEYTITGLVSLKSPSIYTNTSEFITIINNSSEVYDNYMGSVETDTKKVQDFKLYNDQITLTEGAYPQNDYEAIINENYKETYKIGNTVDEKINDNKLKVVGYYHSDTGLDKYLVTENTIKYNLINTKEDIMVSLIEIYLIIRSSFLSRIKEVGILRAIGLKKIDIYKMFSGEILAITILASTPGLILMSYILKELSSISILSKVFTINLTVIIISIILIVGFNLIFGLIPVFTTIRKRPARILSRTDLE